jgi:hypothetical protein
LNSTLHYAAADLDVDGGTLLWVDRGGGADPANAEAVLPELGGPPSFVRD